jgi:hypothetical protein
MGLLRQQAIGVKKLFGFGLDLVVIDDGAGGARIASDGRCANSAADHHGRAGWQHRTKTN